MPGTSTDGTVRPLLEWQYGGNWGNIGLHFINDYYNNADGLTHVATPHAVNYFLWGGGGAWYSNTNKDGAATADAIFASGLNGPDSVIDDVKLAAQFGLKDVGYEGGFKVGDDHANAMQIAANVDPRAAAMSLATLNDFFAAGGDLPIVYSASGAAHYTYSIEEDASGATDIFSQNTPKMQAYLQAGQSLPVAVTNGYTLPTKSNTPLTIDEGNIFSQSLTFPVATYLLHATAPGIYSVTIQGTADSSATKEHLMLDGASLGSVAIPLWSSGVGSSSVVTFTITAAGVYGLAVYDDGPTRINYTGTLTISRAASTGKIISSSSSTAGLVPTINGATAGAAAVLLADVVTASSQNNPGEGAAQAFDGSASTKWLAFASTAWLQYQYANGPIQAVTAYSLTSANDDYGRDPASWQVLGSNDGAHWTVLDTQTAQTFAGRNSANTYTLSASSSYSNYRLNITANTGGSYLQLAEWNLHPAAAVTGNSSSASTANAVVLLTGGTATASSANGLTEGAAQAFDNDSSTKWLAFASTAWLQYAAPTGDAYAVTQYSITSANDDYGRDPASWQILASNDGITWTVLDTQSAQTFSGRRVTNTYSINNTQAYQYYRLNVTANDGGGYTQLADLNLFGSVLTA
jgi:hypothetical protein